MECLTSKYAAMKLLSFYIHIKNIASMILLPPDGLSTVPAAAAPCSPYRYLELCGIALYYFTYYYVYPYHLAFINFFHLFCLRIQHRLISKLRCFSIPMFAAKRIVLLHTLVTKV